MEKEVFKKRKSNDVVGATLSEIVLFLLFACLILLGGALIAAEENSDASKDLADEIKKLGEEVSDAKGENKELRKVKTELQGIIDRLRGELSRRPDKPVIITLPDEEGFRFDSGKSSIDEEFSELLKKKLPELGREIKSSKSKRSDLILEVVGHTDSERIGTRHPFPNLDDLPGKFYTGSLFPYDNVGLGMTRAISVARELLRLSEEPAFSYLIGVEIIPLSAGPMVLPEGSRASGEEEVKDRSRRRIELRLRERVVDVESTE